MPKFTRFLGAGFTTIALVVFSYSIGASSASAQNSNAPAVKPRSIINVESPNPELATDAALFASEAARLASPSAEEVAALESLKKEDITKPEEEKETVYELFAKRPVTEPTWYNFLAYTVQSSVQAGVPANTILLILLLPFLATAVVFFRHVIGLPTLGILFPVALSVTLVATGLFVGTLLLITIVCASFVSQLLLRNIRIMHMSKLALSNLIVAIFIFGALVIGVSYGALTVKNLSFLPILLLILLSEQIVAVQLDRKFREVLIISTTSIGLGIAGYFFLSSKVVQETILLYPELILLLIPINIAIGRYFGLRLSEYFRFRAILKR